MLPPEPIAVASGYICLECPAKVTAPRPTLAPGTSCMVVRSQPLRNATSKKRFTSPWGPRCIVPGAAPVHPQNFRILRPCWFRHVGSWLLVHDGNPEKSTFSCPHLREETLSFDLSCTQEPTNLPSATPALPMSSPFRHGRLVGHAGAGAESRSSNVFLVGLAAAHSHLLQLPLSEEMVFVLPAFLASGRPMCIRAQSLPASRMWR